ncbi:class I SAM-dependent methyltransferase [Mycobacterium sp. Aquia_216]|uniref:class I SAM-dependent methyltransferase n=1 Tax=Mycobacterium sp. Aquia_216 TaxID=2991729 RepID=UPI00227B6DDF|nr:class I SAM-dependent methyltransferase [Mycobacterium sp. Aquia_216]WAJ47341.1 class I SAM-dependent methyltransferase [Mycobacterium sp. Aquia_216]
MSSARSCPVCGAGSLDATSFLEANIDVSRLDEFSYSSRKTPEYMNLELVQCRRCDLVYADSPPSQDDLARAYHVADYDSAEEADDAASAYIRAMQPVLQALTRRESVLEIGTGTGVLLEHLAHQGFTKLVGVEPSASAIAAAPTYRQNWIREGVFEEQNFAPESFDLICCFMTMEHVIDPKVISLAAFRLLRPGGAFVTVTHDYRGWLNRMLGRRSPIIDIEHMQLFSGTSIQRLFEVSGYQNVRVERFVNRYAFRYWWRLAPAPGPVKRAVAKVAEATRVGGVRIRLNVGNSMASGVKPPSSP